MKITLNSGHISLNNFASRLFKRAVSGINKLLPSVDASLSRLSVHIKHIRHRDVFNGSFRLSVPRGFFAAEVKGKTIGETLRNGFERLMTQLKNYKNTHWVRKNLPLPEF